MQTRLFVDAQNLAFVSNMASDLKTKDGLPTQAIFHFFDKLRGVAMTYWPTAITMAWDGGRAVERTKALPGYKASREERRNTPEMSSKLADMARQIPIIKKIAGLMGIIQLEGDGCEADDLLAWALSKYQPSDTRVILSGDKDFWQLVDGQTMVVSTLAKAKFPVVTADNFEEASGGLKPWQWLDFKAMQGDKSDEIPGVPGVGPKTAIDILKRHGTAATFRERAVAFAAGASAREMKVVEHWESFLMARRLMDLRSPMGNVTDARIYVESQDLGIAERWFRRLEMAKFCTDFKVWVEPFTNLRSPLEAHAA